MLPLTLALLTCTIWRAPTNASKWRMGFNSAFKGLISTSVIIIEIFTSQALKDLFRPRLKVSADVLQFFFFHFFYNSVKD